MKHELPQLPYAKNALEPWMSSETLEFHYGKHHAGYVEKLNELIEGTQYEAMPLEEIVRRASGSVFNNAAQAWNHSFFWQSMAPESGAGPSEPLQKALEASFGSTRGFWEELTKSALDVFGSGWIWLVKSGSDEHLSIQATANADTPLRFGATPLLTCDLWEHAYYIDYRNERAKFLEGFQKIVNWDFANRNFADVDRLAA